VPGRRSDVTGMQVRVDNRTANRCGWCLVALPCTPVSGSATPTRRRLPPRSAFPKPHAAPPTIPARRVPTR